MDLEALVLIEQDNDAQRLVVTWPKVGRQYAEAGDDEEPTEQALERWADISGVDIDDVHRLLPMLFGNDIIGPEGMVDDQAMLFIRTRLAGAVRQQATRGPRRT